jgi:hypothetical protein
MCPKNRFGLAYLLVFIWFLCLPITESRAVDMNVSANIAFDNSGGVSVDPDDTDTNPSNFRQLDSIISNVRILGIPNQLAYVTYLCGRSYCPSSMFIDDDRYLRVGASPVRIVSNDIGEPIGNNDVDQNVILLKNYGGNSVVKRSILSQTTENDYRILISIYYL